MLRDIERCGTAALGGHLDFCEACGYEHPVYNPCRNRHCPKCQNIEAERWIERRKARVLPTPHFHVVFTLPSELRALAKARPAFAYDMLFAAATAALQQVAANPKHLGATLGFSAVLHTWTRELVFHPHLHCLVTGGGLAGTQWVPAKNGFLFPVKVLGALLRGKCLDQIRKAHARGVFGGFDPFDDPEGFDRLMARLARHKSWVVYCKPALPSADDVIEYLGRYIQRVGIANSRLVSLVDGQVTFRTHGDDTITLPVDAFLARFVQHVLPRGFVKVRHYGLYAPGNVNTKLEETRTQLGSAPPPSPKEPESNLDRLLAITGRDVTRCPRCRAPLLRLPLPRGPP